MVLKVLQRRNTMPTNNTKTTITMTIILIITALFMATSCKECPNEPEPEVGTVTLYTEYIATKSVYLKITVSDSLEATDIRIERDTTIILETTLFSFDTLIIDEYLEPGKTYNYTGYLIENGRVIYSGDILTVTTMDTTEHDIFTWTSDTLGISGEINDVWIVDEDNIWIVGNIETDSGTFNAARWDGDRWNMMQIHNLAPLYSIWYFDDNNVWVCSGFPKHWDGYEWTMYHLQNMGLDVSVEHIWASSPSDIYFVGYEGSIVHYDGSTFRKMTSGTTCKLDDVYGIDENTIWAVGSAVGEFQSVILFYDGTKWITLHDTGYMGHGYWTNSVWTDSPYFLFLNGGSGRIFYNLVRDELYKDMTAGNWYGYDIDGLEVNDIFATGMGSEVLHYNGSTWHLYTDFKDRFDDYSHFRSVKMNSDFIVIGGFYYTGISGLPIVIRGYR